jgi:hypothetical protein
LTATQNNDAALKTLGKLSDQLDTAKKASEATTKGVQIARHTTEKFTLDVRRKRLKPDAHGKSKAATELGRRGGVARAKTLTKQQRSAVAKKAAKTRWSRQ